MVAKAGRGVGQAGVKQPRSHPAIFIRSVDAAGRQTRGPGQAAGYVSECGEPFYGTRVGPGWYQSGTSVPRGCKPPFSVLRMLMQPSRKPPSCDPQATCKPTGSQPIAPPKPPTCDPQATFMRPSCDPHATLMPRPSHLPGLVRACGRRDQGAGSSVSRDVFACRMPSASNQMGSIARKRWKFLSAFHFW